MRLIDADALLSELNNLEPRCANKYVKQGLDDGLHYYMPQILEEQPTIDAVPVETVAQMFMEFAGHKCACNFNGTDEWLPFYCEHEKNGKCPDPDDVLDCWKQYIKHYEKRNEDGEG